MQGQKKVLIVDDDEMLCQLLSAGLRLRGWNPVSVGNFGSAFVESKQGYDVILLDPGLPDSTPLKTIQDLGRLRTGGEKIYVITGTPIDDALHTLCMESGANGVMSKDSREFMAGLSEVFGK